MDIKSKKIPYNAKDYFESWHNSVGEFSDKMTVNPLFELSVVKYHYNLVENLLIEFFVETGLYKIDDFLDIGSGAGHWIDFYRNTFNTINCHGIEISDPCVKSLKKKYSEFEEIKIFNCDISSSNFNIDNSYDLVNAIGVMFHIVDDHKWKDALINISKLIKLNGYLIVGGDFGLETKDVQFHKIDKFGSWDERKMAWEKFNNTPEEFVFVNKRVRSLADWVHSADLANLKIVALKQSNKVEGIRMPENNILIFKKV